jgi:hypothetical protein
MEETHWEGQNFSKVAAPQEEEEEEGGMMVPDTSLFTLQLPLSVRQPKPDQGALCA